MRQVQVIPCLVLYGEMAQNMIATQLRIETSTLIRILDRMERGKWIERSASSCLTKLGIVQKLGVNAFQYIKDRVSVKLSMPALSDLIFEKARLHPG